MLYQNMDVCADRRFAFEENENETGNDYREYGRFLSPGQDDSDRTFQKPENFSRKNKAYGGKNDRTGRTAHRIPYPYEC